MTGNSSDYSLVGAIGVGLSSGLLILGTILGNGLVLFVFWSDPAVRRSTNWFIVSLAVADLLVGSAIEPLTVIYEISGRWQFGPFVCELWLATDVWLCTASILNIVMIAVDRFLALSSPLTYAYGGRTVSRVLLMILAAWLISFCIAFPPLVGWRPSRAEWDCSLSQDAGYVLYSAMGSFFLPTVVLLVLYVNIFINTRKRSREMRRRVHARRNAIAGSHGVNAGLIQPHNPYLAPRPSSNQSLSVTFESLIGETAKTCGIQSDNQIDARDRQEKHDQELTPKSGHKRLSRVSCTGVSDQLITTDLSGESMRKFELRISKLQKRERQSALLLGSIIVTFIVCWLPFFAVYVMQAVCCSVPELAFDLVFFLGYINSLLNPLVYGLFNSEIRTAFSRAIKKFRKAGSQCTNSISRGHR